MNTYVYQIGQSLYINLTNKCCNKCTFCIRNDHDGIEDYELWLDKEPTALEIINELPRVREYAEAVFCGFGEPTYKMDEIVAVGKFIKDYGVPVRINTNGLGRLINGRDIVPELKEAVDIVSISLNAPDRAGYDAVSRSVYGEKAFDELCDFAEACKGAGLKVIFTVVDVISDEQMEKSKALAEKLGIGFRVRAEIK